MDPLPPVVTARTACSTSWQCRRATSALRRRRAGALDGSDWRCNGSMFPAGVSGQLPQLVVGGVDELRAVLGRDPSRPRWTR